jgi:hypothetical protein
METNEFLIVIAGVGLVSWGLLGIMIHYQKRKDNVPIDKFNRAFKRHQQIMAVHSPDGKMKFKAYDHTHAELEPHMSIAGVQVGAYWDGETQLPPTNHFFADDFTLNQGVMYGSGAGGRGDIIIHPDPLHQNTDVPVEEPDKLVVTEQVIVQHKPGDRFLGIVGE